MVRLANHLDQIRHMDSEERAKWLRWSKLGLSNPLAQTITAVGKEINTEKTLTTILKRPEEMEAKFNNYLKSIKLQCKEEIPKSREKACKRSNQKYSKQNEAKTRPKRWLRFY